MNKRSNIREKSSSLFPIHCPLCASDCLWGVRSAFTEMLSPVPDSNTLGLTCYKNCWKMAFPLTIAFQESGRCETGMFEYFKAASNAVKSNMEKITVFNCTVMKLYCTDVSNPVQGNAQHTAVFKECY